MRIIRKGAVARESTARRRRKRPGFAQVVLTAGLAQLAYIAQLVGIASIVWTATMYSLVLMTALTTAPETADFNGFFQNLFRGGGCSGTSASAGCWGNFTPRYSCYGGGCAGSAYAYGSCTGCSGSAFAAGCSGTSSSGFGSRIRRWLGFGGCSGCSGYGCTGSGYGCTGSGYSCFGSAYSCFGGPAISYTPVLNGGLSCQGGLPMSAPPPMFVPPPATPGVAPPPPTIPYAPPESAPGGSGTAGVRPSSAALVAEANGSGAARATVVVLVPADARLFADGRPLALTGTERRFVSPVLPAGQEFLYRFRVEYERDGETVSVTKKVPVRAGAQVQIEFTDLTARTAPRPIPSAVAGTATSGSGQPERPAVPSLSPAVAPASTPEPPVRPALPTSPNLERTLITVKLPPGATLYVDERKSPSTSAVRQFSTPPLPVGREFAYLLRAEVVRNGQTETFTQKVPFRAGEKVEVDFTSIGSK